MDVGISRRREEEEDFSGKKYEQELMDEECLCHIHSGENTRKTREMALE